MKTQIENNCKIQYRVELSINSFKGRMDEDREHGEIVTTFCKPNPLDARHEAYALMSGWHLILGLGGLEYSSPLEAQFKGFKGFNCYSIFIYCVNLEDASDGNGFIINDGDPEETDAIEALEQEYQLYKHFGYETGKVISKRRKSGTYHAIQLVANFVKLSPVVKNIPVSADL